VGDRLKEKVALVSGAGSSGPGWGNGRATAVLFAREGAKVLSADLKLDAAGETKRIIESEDGICVAVAGNVYRADDVAAMVDACITAFGRIDVLHNNVGIVEVGGPVETSEESWDRVNDVNLKSMFLTCTQVLPHMERQGNGAIVNIPSVSGIRWLGVPYISSIRTKAYSSQSASLSCEAWPSLEMDCDIAEMTFETRNQVPLIESRSHFVYPELKGKDHDSYYQGKSFEAGIEIDDVKYAARFEKAFRHAVTLCGGRPSAF